MKTELTEILAAPDVHEHVVLADALKVRLVDHEESAGDHWGADRRLDGRECSSEFVRYPSAYSLFPLHGCFTFSKHLTLWSPNFWQKQDLPKGPSSSIRGCAPTVGSAWRARRSSAPRYSHLKTRFQSKPPRRSELAPMYCACAVVQ